MYSVRILLGILAFAGTALVPAVSMADNTGRYNANVLNGIFQNWISQVNYGKYAIVGNTAANGSGKECHINVTHEGATVLAYIVEEATVHGPGDVDTAVRFMTGQSFEGIQNIGQVCRDHVVKLTSRYAAVGSDKNYYAEIVFNYTSNSVRLTQDGTTIECFVNRSSYDFSKEAQAVE